MFSNHGKNILIEQPAIDLFSELDRETANCFHENFSDGRDVPRDVSTSSGINVEAAKKFVEGNI